MHDLTKTFELVHKVKAGDQAALNQLLQRYYERVRRSVRARLGAGLRQHLESGDILQQTFAKAFEKFDSFEMRDEGSFLHWLAKIAEGQIRDAADYRGAEKRTPPGKLSRIDDPGSGQPTGEAGMQIPDPGPRPYVGLIKREEQEAMEACLDTLPTQYREVIVLRDYEGLEWKRVAELAGRPSASAAREMHAAAMLALTKCLRVRGIARQEE